MTDVTYQVEIKFDKYLEALLNCADVAPYSKRAVTLPISIKLDHVNNN